MFILLLLLFIIVVVVCANICDDAGSSLFRTFAYFLLELNKKFPFKRIILLSNEKLPIYRSHSQMKIFLFFSQKYQFAEIFNLKNTAIT
jgi:hypothetical protein